MSVYALPQAEEHPRNCSGVARVFARVPFNTPEGKYVERKITLERTFGVNAVKEAQTLVDAWKGANPGVTVHGTFTVSLF